MDHRCCCFALHCPFSKAGVHLPTASAGHSGAGAGGGSPALGAIPHQEPPQRRHGGRRDGVQSSLGVPAVLPVGRVDPVARRRLHGDGNLGLSGRQRACRCDRGGNAEDQIAMADNKASRRNATTVVVAVRNGILCDTEAGNDQLRQTCHPSRYSRRRNRFADSWLVNIILSESQSSFFLVKSSRS
jgi:hypothetical protein